MSFSGDIDAFSKKVEKAANAIFRGTSLELTRRIIKRTPVDTGRLRGNWQAGVNNAPDGMIEFNSEPSKKAGNAINTAKIGDSIYIVNNLPYAGAIEDGGSIQQPLGMVKITVAEYKSIVDAQAKENK